MKRRGRLTMITKSNALRYGMVMWDEILETLRPQYPSVQTDRLHIDAERLAHVRVRRHGVRRDERLDAGVELPIPGAARRHRPGDPRIETADDQAAVPQQVEEDSLIVDAEVLFVYERRRESGQLRDALDDAAPRRALQPGA